MTEREEQSREQWEKEFADVQRNVTPADDLRAGQIIAKKLSASPAPIADLPHLIRYLLCGVLLVVGFLILSSATPHKLWLGLATLIAGLCLGATAFRWKGRAS